MIHTIHIILHMFLHMFPRFQEKQHDLLEKFKAAHPEMDFSKAHINARWFTSLDISRPDIGDDMGLSNILKWLAQIVSV